MLKTRHRHWLRCLLSGLCTLVLVLGSNGAVWASSAGKAVARDHVRQPPAPASQPRAAARAKSEGCRSCHTETDAASMHASPGVVLGCTDCHGGDASVQAPATAKRGSDAYRAALESAHVLPRYPDAWNFPSSRNPERSYTLLNKEAPEFVRFVNPSDYRAVDAACGACHQETIRAAKRSLMATNAMFWGGAAYNNGVLPYKNYKLGEAYTRDGTGAAIVGPPLANPDEARREHGVLARLAPLPAWETVRPADIFRVFERGGRNILNLFPETGLPNVAGQIQRLEEPGRPDIRQSNRGPGTGGRIAVPVLNLTKTRLNDPLMWFLGTNDQPGDYRSSGCAACHVIYANDREPAHSGPYAQYGHTGKSVTTDPTIPKDESGHPLEHAFTRSIPNSQCISCHMHQPNMFMNTYLGYTMWDYEADAPAMWPAEQRYPTNAEIRAVNARNPEAAAARGLWSDEEFLRGVSELNPQLEHTQFADYHGHGWNFRAVFKKDRDGHLLDEQGKIVPHDDPNKFDKAVHMSSVHLDAGMHCVDCHFAQDSHGNGHLYGEVASAVEIDCVDCHGTADEYPDLFTSGPAAPPEGHDLRLLRNPDGAPRFEWQGDELIQRSLVNPGVEWEVSLVKDTVTPGDSDYNPKAARAKLMSANTETKRWGPNVAKGKRAHGNDEMECYTCHTSWTTSCGGCHLPIQANWLSERHHYEGGVSRNFATYNPQVVRDQIFMLGRRGSVNGGRIAPLRSSSALVLSSQNANRERIYTQQPPISASGYSSQAINPHFPHTVRKTETKTCTDCHLSQAGDNNAIMAQLLGYGTDYIDFIGFHVYMGTETTVEAIQVTEWQEPQAVIGSYLHRYAYPDWYEAHQENDQRLEKRYGQRSGRVGCLQHRGEYLFAAVGDEGMRAYDIASIGNKGFSDRIVTAPFSELGQDVQVESEDATCVTLATTQPVHPDRNGGKLMRVKNQETPIHPIYNYALVTDAEEGLILVDINTLHDGEPRNNFLERALTWNANGVLDGARHITMGGSYAYVLADRGLVIVDLDEPMSPQVADVVPLEDPRASHLQFRYLFVTDAAGLEVIDVTDPEAAQLVTDATIALDSAHGVFAARTWVYVAAGDEGLAIIDAERPEAPELLEKWDADGELVDARDISIAHTNASLFGYVADGDGGLKVVQLTSPEAVPGFYGFSPGPEPELIARYPTESPALSLTRGLERDRAVDETGNQVAVFGRLGAGPLSPSDMRNIYLDDDGEPWYVSDAVQGGPDEPNAEANGARVSMAAEESGDGQEDEDADDAR